jgi:CpeT protein
MLIRAFIFLLILSQSLSSQAQSPSLELLAQYMEGNFDSRAQAKQDTNFLDITLKMSRIWEDEPNVVWLYVEQAASNSLNKPYRQRIYQLVELAEGKYASHVFEIPNAERYVGANKKPKLLEDLSISDLIMLDGCQIGLHFAKGAFRGATEGKCPNNWSGASIATSQVEIYKDKLISWDRGWTEDGKQVWGSTKGGYIFIKK